MSILLVLSSTITFISYLFSRRIDHPVVLFSGIWTIIFLLRTINIFHQDPIKEVTFFVLLIMTICFPLGFYLFRNYLYKFQIIVGNRFRRANYAKESQYCLRETLFWILCAISIATMVYYQGGNLVRLIQGTSFLQIQAEIVQQGYSARGSVLNFLFMLIADPMIYLITPICATEFLTRRNNRVRYLVVNIIIVVLSVAHHGGRNAIALFIIGYLLALYSLNIKIKISKRIKRVIIGLIVIAIVIFISVSISRNITNLWESIYTYFVCDIPVFENVLSSYTYNGYTMGYLSFNGFIYVIVSLLGAIFGYVPSSMYAGTQAIRVFLEKDLIFISGFPHSINAFLPVGGFFFIDGGFLFEIVAMIIMGIVYAALWNKKQIYRDKHSIAKYIFFVIPLLFSFVRFYFGIYAFAVAFLWMLIIYKREKNVGEQKIV